MRRWYLLGWLLLPAFAGAWHYGPGQDRLRLDDAARTLAAADAAAKAEDWAKADELYTAALQALPEGRQADARKIRLERAKVQMLASKLPDAFEDLEVLLGELEDDKAADAKLRAETRRTFASAQFYLTWLMRLEGAAPAEWEPVVDAARQNYKLLAEQALKAGDKSAAGALQDDLEAAIKLARMDLGELQGLPLPSQ